MKNKIDYLTKMTSDNNILEVTDLRTYFNTENGVAKAVDGVSFSVPKNKIVGIVGESGSGKSVTCLSALRLLPEGKGKIFGGSIKYQSLSGDCYDIAKMPLSAMNKVRGKEISMIFQEPMTSLNPVFTIGYQLDEATLLHSPKKTKSAAKERSIEMLNLVGMSGAERIYKSYPHELSGGMRQRVMIAMSIICNPRLIIADEPTTALDVTVQAEILELLKRVKEKIGGSLLLITHDLGVIAEMADIVLVMYAGKIIERGTVKEIFNDARHPYTLGLQQAKPKINENPRRLFSIKGQAPNPTNMPVGCYFSERCIFAREECLVKYPGEVSVGSVTHKVSCYKAAKA